jgi:alpha-1,6-mannosyltransferase
MFLLSVGRIAREKNIRQVLAMLDCLGRADGGFHLVMVGDGELRRLVRRRAAAGAGLTWIPYCGDSGRLAELYSACDLLIHAGTAETFGLVSLEAQACGSRVLAVRGGGLDETLEFEPHPVMAESAEPAALAEGVRRVRDLAEPVQARLARSRVVHEHFACDGTYTRLLHIYDTVCASRAAGRMLEESDVAELQDSPAFAL